jgi:peroxiredoxin
MGGAAPVAPVALKVGDPAPEIDGTDLDGKPMKLSEFRGKVVVLDFWGDWCPFCKNAYTYQNHLINRLKGEPFVLLGVNCDATRQQAQLVVTNQKIGWRSWYDEGGQMMNGPIYRSYGVRAVPTTFVIDKKGIIQQRFDGLPSELALDNSVDIALALDEKRPAGAPPRWQPGSTAFGKLGDEVEVGRYRLRLPAGFAPAGVPPIEGGRQTYRWQGPKRPDGTVPVLEVVLSPAQAAEKNLDAVLEKDVGALAHPTLGWSCSAAERGEVKGLTFARVRWSIMESPVKPKAFGFLYAAVDGDTLIRISCRDNLATFGTPQDAVPLTFRKAPAK